MLIRIFKTWLNWRRDWDSLCNCCGKCCYTRTIGKGGRVTVHYDAPCKYLDTQTHLCRVYDDRFRKCGYCGKMHLRTALFNPTLPEDCGYVKAFRLWRNREENEN